MWFDSLETFGSHTHTPQPKKNLAISYGIQEGDTAQNSPIPYCPICWCPFFCRLTFSPFLSTWLSVKMYIFESKKFAYYKHLIYHHSTTEREKKDTLKIRIFKIWEKQKYGYGCKKVLISTFVWPNGRSLINLERAFDHQLHYCSS